MHEYITGDDFFSHLLLLAQADPRAIVMLEGPSDCRLLDPFLDRQSCGSVPAHGKEVALSALKLNDATARLTRMIAILDRDWFTVAEDAYCSPDVVYTEHYDLAMDVVVPGDPLVRVVSNVGALDSLERFVLAKGFAQISDFLTALALPMGVARLVSYTNRLAIKFGGKFPYSSTLAEDASGVSIEALARVLVRRSANCGVTEEQLVGLVEAEKGAVGEPKHYCCSHDMVGYLSAVLRLVCGVSGLGPEAVEGRLRTAVGWQDLGTTRVVQEAREWGSRRGVKIWQGDP